MQTVQLLFAGRWAWRCNRSRLGRQASLAGSMAAPSAPRQAQLLRSLNAGRASQRPCRTSSRMAVSCPYPNPGPDRPTRLYDGMRGDLVSAPLRIKGYSIAQGKRKMTGKLGRSRILAGPATKDRYTGHRLLHGTLPYTLARHGRRGTPRGWICSLPVARRRCPAR